MALQTPTPKIPLTLLSVGSFGKSNTCPDLLSTGTDNHSVKNAISLDKIVLETVRNINTLISNSAIGIQYIWGINTFYKIVKGGRGRVSDKIKQQQGGAKLSEIPKCLFHLHLQMGYF